jgi:hypothetical protein
MIKLTLPGKVELQVSVQSCSTPKQFIMHIQQAINVIKQKRLKEAYKKCVGSEKECSNKLKETRLSLKISKSKIEEDSIQAKAVKMATEAHDKAKESVASVTDQIFLLYSNLLLEEARQPWNKILAEQIYCSPQTDFTFWQCSSVMQPRHKSIT